MRICDACGARFGEGFSFCPICKMETAEPANRDAALYPPCRNKARAASVLRLIGICVLWGGILASVVVNLAVGGAPWCLYVLSGTFTLYVLAFGDHFMENSVVERIASGGLAISLLLFVIERLTDSGRWATHIAVPMVLFAALLAAALIYLIRFDTQRNTFLSPLAIILGSLCAAGFSLFGGNPLHWPLIVLSGVSLLVMVVTGILYRKPFMTELRKKLHR